MSESRSVKCDGCNRDLTTTTNMEAYRLVLANQGIPTTGNVLTARGEYPAIGQPVHFCGLDCLRVWLDANRPAALPLALRGRP